jgi:fatty acid desaturase
MIGGLIGRGLLAIAFVLALLCPAIPVFGYLVAALVGVAFILCCACQKSIWLDGWHAAHDHHDIDNGERHLFAYKKFLSQQGWM